MAVHPERPDPRRPDPRRPDPRRPDPRRPGDERSPDESAAGDPATERTANEHLGPTGPYPSPEHAAARHRDVRFPFDAGLPAIGIIVGAFGLAGVVAGIVWSRLGLLGGPIEAIMYEGRPVFADEVTAARLFEMDGSFAVVGAITGLVLGAVLYPIFRRHGPWTVGALVVGGLLGAVVSFAVGTFAANDQLILAWNPTGEQGTTVSAPLTLHAYGVAAAWPMSALASVLILCWLWRPESPGESGADRVIHTSDHPGVSTGDHVR